MTEARQTPLPDLLDGVPEKTVLGIRGDEPMFPSYTNIPIGRLAREAAAELRRLAAVEAQRDALLEALRAIVHAATVHACHHALSVDGQQFYDIARAAIAKAEEA